MAIAARPMGTPTRPHSLLVTPSFPAAMLFRMIRG
jgi:hypothetical protein